MTSEEFERALSFYDKTLELEAEGGRRADRPRAARSRFSARRKTPSATTDRLIAIGWYVGDARYWRAFNENELERYDEAWPTSRRRQAADQRRGPEARGPDCLPSQQLDVSRSKFNEAHGRNKNDCETFFYLGIRDAELGAWGRTAEILPNAAVCLQANEDNYRRESRRSSLGRSAGAKA